MYIHVFSVVSAGFQQLFTAASGIVESVANEVIAPTDVEQPNIDYIVRVVNRKRRRLRPEDPKDLDFEVIQYINCINYTKLRK